MKKILIFLFGLILFGTVAQAQEFTLENIYEDFLDDAWEYSYDQVVMPDGNPVVSYCDEPDDYKIKVKKWNGSNRENIGQSSLPNIDGYYQSITNNGNDIYIAYCDGGISYEVSVIKWNGSTWSYVGEQGMSTNESRFTEINVDTDGNPIVAYYDSVNDNIVSKKWNGSSRINLTNGSPFTVAPRNNPSAPMELEQDTDGNLYFAYAANDNNTIYTYKLSGTTREQYGPTFVDETINIFNFAMAIDNNGYPILAIESDDAGAERVVVKRNNGTSREELSTNASKFLDVHDVAIDEFGVPVIAVKYGWAVHDPEAGRINYYNTRVVRRNGTDRDIIKNDEYISDGQLLSSSPDGTIYLTQRGTNGHGARAIDIYYKAYFEGTVEYRKNMFVDPNLVETAPTTNSVTFQRGSHQKYIVTVPDGYSTSTITTPRNTEFQISEENIVNNQVEINAIPYKDYTNGGINVTD